MLKSLKKGKLLTLLFAFTFFITACEDVVDIPAPPSEIASEGVFESPGLAEIATLNAYRTLNDVRIFGLGFGDLSIRLAFYADDLNGNDSFFGGVDVFYQNNLNALSPEIERLWADCYRAIFDANVVINGLENSESLPLDLKRQLRGEALFCRAFMNLYLVNLFGDIPYVTSLDILQNNEIEKTPVDQVYELIIADLVEAKELLPFTYPEGTTRARANRGTISALLSRVYLYAEDWAGAAAESSEVIDNPTYSLDPDFKNVFLVESESIIFQLAPTILNANTLLAGFNKPFDFAALPLTESLLSAFEPGDLRREQWVDFKTGTFGDDEGFIPCKYAELSNGTETTQMNVVMRLAEQYLIRAEARARLNDISGAQEDLNVVRSRAGLQPTLSSDSASLIDAVLKERQVELFTEYGHRFFDLRRMGKIDEVFSTIPEKSGYETTDALFPIPATEILANENLLPQNPGY